MKLDEYQVIKVNCAYCKYQEISGHAVVSWVRDDAFYIFPSNMDEVDTFLDRIRRKEYEILDDYFKSKS